MQFVHVKQGSTDLQINRETLNEIKQFPTNTKYVVIFGEARTGKSAVLNVFSSILSDGQQEWLRFDVSRASEPFTEGVWFGKPIPLGDGTHVVLVDSEGTNMGRTSHHPKMLSLACLIACNGGVLIHNEKSYADPFLSTLATLVSARNFIKGLKTEAWPYLCLLLRNFDQDMTVNRRPATPDQFFAHLLTDVEDSHDADRQIIRNNFSARTLFTLPPPTVEERRALDQRAELPTGPFKSGIADLKQKILAIVQPKTIGGVVCDGEMMAAFLEECVNSVNRDNNIEIPGAVEAAMDAACTRFANDVFMEYKQGMSPISQNLTGDAAPLMNLHTEKKEQAIASYNAHTEGLFPKSVVRMLSLLVGEIDTEYMLTCARNELVREEKSRKEAERAARQAEEVAQQAQAAALVAERAREAAEITAQQEADARKMAEIKVQQAQAEAKAAEARAVEATNQRIRAEQRAAEAEAQARNRRRTFLNGHGFVVDGARIW